MPAPRKREPRSISPSPQIHFEDCWAKTTNGGKPGISVRDHCLNVGCVAEALLALLSSQLRRLVPPGAATLAALHDIGKVSPGFQAKCIAWITGHAVENVALKEGWSARESDHAKISQFTVQEMLGSLGIQRWAAAIGAHHGRIKGERVQVCEPWEEERRRLATELITKFEPLPDEPPGEAALWFLAGLITVSDWIGSDERHFPQDAKWSPAERREQAQTALQAIGCRVTQVRTGLRFSDCFPQTPKPNSLQKAAVQVVRGPGIYILEAPMGSGKTEAALAATYELIASGRACGLYFALPTQVTSNRIHIRVQQFLDQISIGHSSVRLAHSASWLAEAQPPSELAPAVANDLEASEHARAGLSWFASAKRALLAPFGVGTIDQALLGVVAAKHFFVRQFGLAGKVVVLDEVHSYDLYTSTLIGALVNRLRELNSTVIILSATLTTTRRRELLGLADDQPLSERYPLVSGMAGSFIERASEPPPSRSIRVRSLSGMLPVEEVIERAARGTCLLWIRNTVDEAQETYRALRGANFEGGPAVALLHSRFPFFRREQLESEWMARLGKDSTDRPAGCILVSTQVAEQSVDIDADLLITDLAPSDMLLQRLGRLWRHERSARPCSHPEVWIQMPEMGESTLRVADEQQLRQVLGKSARVYAPYVLLRTLSQWRMRTAITLPDEIRAVLEATYAPPADNEPLSWKKLHEQLEHEKDNRAQLASSATRVWTNETLKDEEGVQTRYTRYPAAKLVLVRTVEPLAGRSIRLELLNGSLATASDCKWNFEVAKAIYRNLVPLPRWTIAAGLHSAPPWLKLYVPQPAAVGVVGQDGEVHWPADERPTGLSYDPNQGVIISREQILGVNHEEEDESYD